MTRQEILLRRIRWMTALVMIGLIFGGLTAIPLETEIEWFAGPEAAGFLPLWFCKKWTRELLQFDRNHSKS